MVEDDPFLRMYAVDVIEKIGFTAYEAASADQAIAHLERHPKVAALFTDIQMPGSMDGLKLAHRVHAQWPKVGIIVASGQQKVTAERLPPNGVFLSKPYEPSMIKKALDRVLQ